MDIKDITGIGEVGKLLIEKVSGAIGLGYEPYHIKRISKAEADVEAEKIRAIGRIENITELEKRGFMRQIYEAGKNEENIENILLGAPEYLNANANPNNINEDWIRNFFDKAKLTSDIEMQQIWSRILAGEANSPGMFSKRTINLMQSLEKNDAILFTKLCGFSINKENPQPLVFNLDDKIYSDEGITFSTLKHFDSIGLVSFESLAGYRFTGLSKTIDISYYGKTLHLELQKDSDNELNIGKVLLTGIGKELASICNPEPIKGFEVYMIEYWKELEIKVTI